MDTYSELESGQGWRKSEKTVGYARTCYQEWLRAQSCSVDGLWRGAASVGLQYNINKLVRFLEEP